MTSASTAASTRSQAAADEVLGIRPELTLDGVRPTREQLVQRLAAFWFPDEVVLYIGLAGPRTKRPAKGELAKRVGEYYKTPLGANGPHAGGWPLKTLSCLPNLFVHYAYCDQVKKAEDDCIGQFAKHVSDKTRTSLHDPTRLMPFANLEFPKGNAKDHGIRGARAPKVKRRPKVLAPARPTGPPNVPQPASVRTARSRTHRGPPIAASSAPGLHAPPSRGKAELSLDGSRRGPSGQPRVNTIPVNSRRGDSAKRIERACWCDAGCVSVNDRRPLNGLIIGPTRSPGRRIIKSRAGSSAG